MQRLAGGSTQAQARLRLPHHCPNFLLPAAAYTAHIREFLEKHERAVGEAAVAGGADGEAGDVEMEDAEEREEEEEEDDESLPGGSAAAAARLLRDVRLLAKETMRVCQPELRETVLQGGAVPLDDLVSLLRVLTRLVATGTSTLLEPGDKEGSLRAQRALTAMEAAATALHLMGVPNMPPRGAPAAA